MLIIPYADAFGNILSAFLIFIAFLFFCLAIDRNSPPSDWKTYLMYGGTCQIAGIVGIFHPIVSATVLEIGFVLAGISIVADLLVPPAQEHPTQ